MHEGDDARRLQFCHEIRHRIHQDPDFMNKIIFTDESTFGQDEYFNMHNNHYYAEENPHETVVQNHLVRFKINLWA